MQKWVNFLNSGMFEGKIVEIHAASMASVSHMGAARFNT